MNPPISFDPGSFTDVFTLTSAQTHAIWDWLWHDDNIVRMETASYLDKVAVAPLQPGLLADFDPEFIRRDRIKQMIGRMVRQLMEHRGYVWAGKDFKVAQGKLFSTGSKYKLPGQN
jgi:hypothetical protein